MARSKPAWTAEFLRSPHTTPDKARRVRRMFNAIAPRYELVNSLFSAGRDAVWRRKAVALAKVREDDVVLDVACGTGNFARAFADAGPRLVVGCDFAHEMLTRAGGRVRGRPGSVIGRTAPVRWCEADALRLPFRAGGFSIVSCAFGVRNFDDLAGGLREMRRVLMPGGRAVILEFTRPRRPLLRGVFEFYAKRIMPAAASLVSGDTSGAYRYLPQSVLSFLDTDQMCAKFEELGFSRSSATSLTMGVVSVYIASVD